MPALLLLLLLLSPAEADEPTGPQPPDAPHPPSLPDGDLHFIQQLRSHGLHDLARQICLRRQSQTQNAAAKARWEILFTDSCQDQAWLLPTQRRRELISLAASHISELLNQTPQSPDSELNLRLRQLELLAAASEIEYSAIQLHSHTPNTNQLKFPLDACTQTLQLAETLLNDSAQLASILPPQTLRDIRFRIRATALETKLRQIQLSPPHTTPEILSQIQLEAETLLKGLATQHIFRARLVLARILLQKNDLPALELQLRSLATDAASPADRYNLELLHQLRLLKLRQPTELIARNASREPSNNFNTPELQTLQLHAQLQLCELLSEIELNRRTSSSPSNTPNTDSQLQQAAHDLRSLCTRLSPQLQGVWLERLHYCERRLKIVLIAGPTAANAVEAADVLLDGGDTTAALEKLRQITTLPSANNTLKAIAHLRAGEILVRQSRWNEALEELNLATQSFASERLAEQHAAADLLRLFILAQLHRQPNTDQTPETPETSHVSHYQLALDQHIRNFPSQSSVEFAREYRARLLKSSNPKAAAEDLLAIPTPTPNAPQQRIQRHLRKLALLGDIILNQTTPPTPHSHSLPSQYASEFAAQADSALDLPIASSAPETRILQLQRLTQTNLLHTPSNANATTTATPPPDWQSILEKLRQLLTELPSATSIPTATANTDSNTPTPSHHSNPESTDDAFDFPAVADRAIAAATSLQLLACSRLLLPPDEIQPPHKQLLKLSAAARQKQVLLLIPHLADPTLPGNPALATLAAELLDAPETANKTPAQILADLPLLMQLQKTGAPGELVNRALSALTKQPLDTQHIRAAATALATAKIQAPAPFWKQVQQQTRSGEPAWLEATLQLASLAAAENRNAEALRILRTVSVLHPAWGSPERQQRAAALLKSLEPAP